MKCQECGDGTANREDPRDPPLELGGKVLCEGCFTVSLDELIEEAENNIAQLKARRN